MNVIAKFVVIAAFLLPPVSAGATLTVPPSLTVVNRCSQDLKFAAYYLDIRNRWTTTLVKIRSRDQQESVISTNNRAILYYAETTGSPQFRWAGDRNTTVDGKVYPMIAVNLLYDQKSNSFSMTFRCQ